MLSYFLAQNYKCLERVEFPLTPIHVLIGPNDSGKTSTLEAMCIYMQSTAFPIPVADTLPAPWSYNELVFHGAEDGAGVSLMALGDGRHAVKTHTDPLSYIMGYGFEFITVGGQNCQIKREWRFLRRSSPISGGPNDIESAIPPGNQSVMTTPASLRQQKQNPEQQLQLPPGMFGSANLFRFDPKVLALPAAPAPERTFRLDSDGFGLATVLDDILGYDPDLFLKLRKSFCEFFPQFKAVRLVTAPAYYRSYRTDGVHLTTAGQTGKEIVFETSWGKLVHARQASEGVLLFLAFLALVHLPPPHKSKLILVEDVESGVYPKKLEELVTALKNWVSANPGEDTPQIVLSTHSPHVLAFFSPEEVTFLSRKDGGVGGVRARPLRDAPNIKERLAGGFYLGELWYNLTEEELFGGSGR
jgi:hypothetical protein